MKVSRLFNIKFLVRGIHYILHILSGILRKILPSKVFYILSYLWRESLIFLLQKSSLLRSINFSFFRRFAYNEQVAYLEIYKVASTTLLEIFLPSKKAYNKDYDILKYANTLFNKTTDFAEVKHKFKFTFVRNPFSRIYSLYKNKFVDYKKWDGHNMYIKRVFETDKYSAIRYKSIGKTIQFTLKDSFKTFIEKVAQIPDERSEEHFVSQSCFIYKYKTCLVNYVGKYENLKEDFEPIRKKYGFRKLAVINQTQKNKDEWKKHYTKEIADLVYKRYKKDFELWYPNAYDELMDYLEKKSKK